MTFFASGRSKIGAIALCAAAMVVAAYARVGGNGFVDFDDGAYVYDNQVVREGLSLRGLAWAFGSTHAGNWHPLTWVSHMLDVSLFGMHPGAHHWVNLALHAANTALLLLVLRSLTGAKWRSAFVAALFGLHPLHVESVAWLAERKDVLSAFFGIVTLGAYARYAHAPSRRRLAIVAGSFALGLLCKPMLVTLPALLLLLDFWPLRRWDAGLGPPAVRLRSLVAEKLPLFALAAASCVVTVIAQSRGSATATLESFPLGERLANAAVAYGAYLLKAFWPASLGVFYPHPSTLGAKLSLAPLLASLAALAAITVGVMRQVRRRPWLPVGWFWYLGMLVPVIGVVQVGSQAMADRYTYIPLIGIFLMVSWGLDEVSARRAGPRAAVVALVAASLVALGARTWAQTGVWRDSTTLYRHAVRVDAQSWLAWNNLGNQHLGRGELDPAMDCFQRALSIYPYFGDAWYNAGCVHLQRLDREEAITAFRRALELDPENADAWNNLGVAQLNLGRYDEAAASCEASLRHRPDYGPALQNLALAHALRGDRARFEAARDRLLAVDPARAEALREQVDVLRRRPSGREGR